MSLLPAPVEHGLTQHEVAILRALADGAQSKEMAALIKRSRGTVEFYIRSLFLKLNARSRPHLVAQAFRNGLLTIEPDASADSRRR
jgi:DNA-binding NarL/FixJ family response regulator